MDIARQDEIVQELGKLFDRVSVVDRRERPSHGYRAVHVVPQIQDTTIELQIRTELQHRWAELSEKLSDIFDHSIKYGGGPDGIRQILRSTSKMISSIEVLEPRIAPSQLRALAVIPEMRATIENNTRVVNESKMEAHEAQDGCYAFIRQFGEERV